MPGDKFAKCETANCQVRCLNPSGAALVVVIACTLALAVPFLRSMGVELQSAISSGVNITWLSIGIAAVWLVSIYIGCKRKHEHPVECFFDALGIPAVILAVTIALK